MILSLSHYDLDGIGCQILLNQIGQCDRKLCSYHNLTESLYDIEDTLQHKKYYSSVYITDLNLNVSQLEVFTSIVQSFPDINFMLLDHHAKEMSFNPPSNCVFIQNTQYSSTELLRQYLGLPQNTFLESVNAFDIWDIHHPHFNDGLVLNYLFFNIKPNAFFSRFKDMNMYNNTDLRLYNQHFEKVKQNFEKLKQQNKLFENDNIILSFNNPDVLYSQLIYPEASCIINVTLEGKTSVRLSEKYISTQMAQDIVYYIQNMKEVEIKNIGGHLHIIIFSIKDITHSNIITVLKKLTEYVIKAQNEHRSDNSTTSNM